MSQLFTAYLQEDLDCGNEFTLTAGIPLQPPVMTSASVLVPPAPPPSPNRADGPLPLRL